MFMQVRVLKFGVLKELFSAEAELLELPSGARVTQLFDHYRRLAPEQKTLWPTLAVAVNYEYVREDHLLNDGDEVALLPPVSGGLAVEAPYVAITHDPINAQRLRDGLPQSEDGAVVIFDGIVRNNSRGRRTSHLFYESYEAMALAQMKVLARQAAEEHTLSRVVVVHRIGRLEIGETSIWIGVASPHRGEAFAGCRWLIDTIKKTVPIWKQEYFVDGAVWVQGEAFPAELIAQPELTAHTRAATADPAERLTDKVPQ